MSEQPQPIIRQYIAPGGLGWVIALVVLILCVVFWVVGGRVNPMELQLIGLLALARLV